MSMYDFQESIQCPHCNYDDFDPSDIPDKLELNGDKATMNCPECKEDFRVMIDLTPRYSSFTVKEEAYA